MARGGKVEGTPGKAYGNRTDLNEAPSGGQYGDKAAMQARMNAVPVRPAPAPPQAPQMQAPLVAPGALDRPTERPMEPITSGLPTGPGPGPEVLGLPTPTNDMVKLSRYLPILELAASRPGSTQQMRDFVRRVRSSAPTEGLT